MLLASCASGFPKPRQWEPDANVEAVPDKRDKAAVEERPRGSFLAAGHRQAQGFDGRRGGCVEEGFLVGLELRGPDFKKKTGGGIGADSWWGVVVSAIDRERGSGRGG